MVDDLESDIGATATMATGVTSERLSKISSINNTSAK